MSIGTVEGALSRVERPNVSSEPSLRNPVVLAILLLLGVSYAFNGMDRQVFPALLGPINKDYGLTLAQGGFLSTCFAVFIAIFGGFSGWCMVRFSRKWTMIGGLVAYSIFTFITPLAKTFLTLTIYRSMTGAGEAFQIGAIFSIVGAYFGSNRGAAMGIINSIYGVGAFLGPALGTRLFVSSGSWRLPFYVFGLAGIVIALVVAVFVPQSFASAVDREKKVAPLQDGTSATSFLNRNTILFGLAWFLIGYTYFAFSALYTTYLRVQLGFSTVNAGTIFGMYGVGAMTAVVFGGLGDKLKRAGHLVVMALLPIVSYAMFHGAWSYWVHSFLCFMCGALISGYLYPRFVAVVQRSVEPAQIGYVMSLLLPLFYVPGLVAGFAFGKLVGLVGWGLAATISVLLPATLGFAVTCFYDPRQVRGE